ncbi:hypothetical protein [Halospeciosus flavus]|uniref:DUF7979 domain-containing protein n=1 Tax=Halospeciosus flavus TaxID=3032283 RepID=A0ABD5Z3P9_9EURY|nr:hypothetical protein [Halospeciosus flavus]
MSSTTLRAVAVVAVVALAGCAGSLGPTETTTTSPTSGPPVLTVNPVHDESVVSNASVASKARFENLSTAKQREFRRALEREETVTAEAWDSGSDVQYVRYEGAWYHVEVHVR